jgi:hypothetical protein
VGEGTWQAMFPGSCYNLSGQTLTASQKGHLRRSASSFVITTYNKYASFLKTRAALHLGLFTVPSI